MSDKNSPDDQLAEFTDRVLKGESAVTPEELKSEAQLVRQLNKLIAPQDSINTAFQQRLTRTITQEWNQKYSKRASRRGLRLYKFSQRQLALVAGFTVFILLLMLSFIPGDNANGTGTMGTAAGDASFPVLIIIVGFGLLVLAGIALWIWRKRD